MNKTLKEILSYTKAIGIGCGICVGIMTLLIQKPLINEARNQATKAGVAPERLRGLDGSFWNMKENTRTIMSLGVLNDSVSRAKDSTAMTKITPKLTTPQITSALNAIRRP